MLGWALTFLVVALIAAILGFGGIAAFAVDIAKIVFVVALVLFVISAVVGPRPRANADGAVTAHRRGKAKRRAFGHGVFF